MNVLEAIKVPRYALDFIAGWEAAELAAKTIPVETLDRTAGEARYHKVWKRHGFTWLNGWCAVLDSSRGAYTDNVKAALELGL